VLIEGTDIMIRVMKLIQQVHDISQVCDSKLSYCNAVLLYIIV